MVSGDRGIRRVQALGRVSVIRQTRERPVTHHGPRSPGRPTVRATHGRVEERVDGTMRSTHHGRPRDDHAFPLVPRAWQSLPTTTSLGVRSRRGQIIRGADACDRGEHRNRTVLHWVDIEIE